MSTKMLTDSRNTELFEEMLTAARHNVVIGGLILVTLLIVSIIYLKRQSFKETIDYSTPMPFILWLTALTTLAMCIVTICEKAPTALIPFVTPYYYVFTQIKDI